MVMVNPTGSWPMNSEQAKQYVGGVVFITILMVTGILGNLHVVFVYAFKIKPSNHRIFILILGVIDLIACSIVLPFIIVVSRKPLTFTMVYACKVMRFISSFVVTCSASILLVIAVERYRKIYVPLGKQISQKAAKLLCLVMFGVTLLLTWPAPVLYGGHTVNIANHNMSGTRCYTEDRFKGTKFQGFFNAVLMHVVFAEFTVLVVLYSLIARVILKHPQFNVKHKTADKYDSSGSGMTLDTMDASPTSINTLPMTAPIEPASVTAGGFSDSEQEEPLPATKVDHPPSKTNDKQGKADSRSTRMRRTTYMLFMITVVFFLTYFPYFIMKIVLFAFKDFVPSMSFAGKLFFNTVIQCSFINNAANFIIYSFCDVRFRQEVFGIYRRLFIRNLNSLYTDNLCI